MAETTEIRLPRLADAVASVRFGAWLKQEGDQVEAGEPIAEVETDKTTVELESPAAGVLCDLRVAAGADGLEVGAVLARIAPAAGAGAVLLSAGAARVEPVEPADPPAAPGDDSGHHRPDLRADVEPADPPAAPGDFPVVPNDEVVPAATPLALRMAAAAGLDLSAVRAAGADGRIRKADIDRVLAARRGAPIEAAAGGFSPHTASSPAPLRAPGPPRASEPMEDGGDAASGGGSASPAPGPSSGSAEADAAASPYRDRPLTAMRRVTAARMQQAKQTVPHFYLRTECRVDAALSLLAAARRQWPEAPPTLTDLVVRAAACALRRVPEANSAWADGTVRVYDRVDVAVAVNTPHGLMAPVVRGADGKDLAAVARETRALVARARAGRLAPAEYAGGTFTVSNLGMYGVESLYAIVNPPQSCILGVGAAARRPVAAGDGVVVGAVMACTLSADHRVIDGAAGAELLEAVRSNLEQPGLMLLPTEARVPRSGRADSS